MKLVQEGKINLDADINTYLKSWKFPYDSLSRNKKISLRNLLSHTAGLSVHGFRGYESSDTIPTLLQILNGERPANSPAIRSLFEPSKKFQYSGGGTTITQLLLTDITGMRYEEYMKKNVLDPLGMTNSFYNQPPPAGTKNLATGYYSGNSASVKGKYHVYPEQAAAGLWTTPTDLAKYIIETLMAYQGKSAKVLSSQTTRERLTPYIDSTVALGSFLLKKQGELYFNHNGGNEAFLCTSFGNLNNGNGVVIMINSDNYAIISEISNSVATVYGWKDFYNPVFKKKLALSRDTLQTYTGKYLIGTDTLAVSFCGEQLCIRQNGNPPKGFNLIFSSSREASVKELPGIVLTFMSNAAGKIDALEVNEGGVKSRCVRIE
jgi:CubicO group peptidase (beta-lactamase class C family)